MSYQVLARKWRPRDFSEMVGQAHVVQALSNALDNDRLHHAYLFTGTRGVGKTTLARILSKSLNCERGVSASPCGQCGVCTEIDDGRFVDLLEVDAASKTGVDDTRELLDNVPYAPVRGRYKVYLIDEVHMFSGHSFNALLKTLEEPPPHVKFLLATTDPQKVPVTVLSRCLQFNLKRLPVEQIRGQFEHILAAEAVRYDAAALDVLARAADGSMRDGLSLLDQAISFGGGAVEEGGVKTMLGVVATERLPDLIEAVHAGDASTVMAEVAAMSQYAPDYGGVLKDVLTLLHRIAILQQVPDAAQAGWGDIGRLRALAASLPAEDVQLYYQIGLLGQRDLPFAPDERSGFEMIMLRMLAFRPAAETGPPKGASGAGRDRAAGSPVPRPPREPDQQDAGAAAMAPRRDGVAEQAAATGTSPADFADWPAFVASLNLSGMGAQLAANCVFRSWDGRQLSLRVDPVCSSMVDTIASQRLKSAIEARLERKIVLGLEAETGTDETPAQQRARAQAQRQKATEADIAGDPLVVAVQESFEAEIVPDSIRRLD